MLQYNFALENQTPVALGYAGIEKGPETPTVKLLMFDAVRQDLR